jgi:acyl carrier protein
MLALENEFDTEFPVALLRRSTFESIENLDAALEDVLGAEV